MTGLIELELMMMRQIEKAEGERHGPIYRFLGRSRLASSVVSWALGP